jgi:hypothetical protein
MKTFSQTKIAFLEVFAHLKRLEGPEMLTQTLRVVKEREAGKLCYQAEEDFVPSDLALLKETLNIEEAEWKMYKQRFRENVGEVLE